MRKTPQKILIIQTAFIGDVILATALLETLHEAIPEASISFLVRKGNESLLVGHPFLDKCWIWDKKKKWKSAWQVLKAVRKERYDWIINLQRFFSMGLFTVLAGGKFTIGFRKNPFSWLFSRKVEHKIEQNIHETMRNFSLIQDLIPIPKTLPPRLYPSREDFDKIKKLQDKPYVCIAPTSVWFTKQFPLEQWIKFIQLIPEQYKIYLLGSPHDHEACEKIMLKQKVGQEVHNLAGKVSLLQSAALMQQASMNYVNDSAPMHLASALNAPTCAVFCSTIPDFGFGPLAEKSFVIETAQKLTCRPCGLHGKKACPEGHFDCAYTISLEKMAETLL